MNELYEKTAKRLARAGVNDPTAQIIYLAEEIERYRDKIKSLEALRYKGPDSNKNQDAQLIAALDRVVREYEKAKMYAHVRNPLAWALYKVWKITDNLETRL